ncbi:nuclear transport factor 2 family protein [Flavobacterium faecale]|uniref:nuclear transport factor 2 family protein n=1 Tax=Flavobacterium faecale TaxID=1355330 RepID=UPI003AAE2BF3
MTTNEKKIHQFYSILSAGDTASLSEFYAPDVKFRDPIFGLLTGKDVFAMWTMLIEKGKGNLHIKLSDTKADDYLGATQWTATYTYGPNNNKVVNTIQANFHFKDGLIIKHTDDFDIWKWSKQALGFKGFLFGWTGYMQHKIHKKALESLRKYKVLQSDKNQSPTTV